MKGDKVMTFTGKRKKCIKLEAPYMENNWLQIQQKIKILQRQDGQNSR